jgi:hypothetical protein
MIANPFTFGNPIHDPTRFIGRQTDLLQIVNRLRSSAHESTSIVGERRMGKTSLLKHLENKQVAERIGLPAEEFCLVYMDFQGLTDITPTRFWKRVLQKIERTICDPALAPEIKTIRALDDFDLFDLEDLFAFISDKGLTIVLLLDEFEYVTQNPNFRPNFFGGLRALAIHHNLPLVTGTRRELVDLCHSEELKGSPFFNIFANLVLRPFTNEEVNTLISSYLEETEIQFNQAETDFVLSLGGGYPFFTQIAAHYVFDAKNQGLSGDLLFKNVAQAFDHQADAHFQYMWSHTSESEKITLLVVMTLNKQKSSPKTIPTLENLANYHSRAHLDIPELIKHGMLIKNSNEDTYQILSPSLERWIAREILAAPGEEETETSVSQWLSTGGRDELEPVKGFLPKFKKKYWPLLADFTKDISLGVIGNIAYEIITHGMF